MATNIRRSFRVQSLVSFDMLIALILCVFSFQIIMMNSGTSLLITILNDQRAQYWGSASLPNTPLKNVSFFSFIVPQLRTVASLTGRAVMDFGIIMEFFGQFYYLREYFLGINLSTLK